MKTLQSLDLVIFCSVGKIQHACFRENFRENNFYTIIFGFNVDSVEYLKDLLKLSMTLFSNGSKLENSDVSWNIIFMCLTAESLCEVSSLCEQCFIPKSLFISDEGKLHVTPIFFYFSTFLHMTRYLEEKCYGNCIISCSTFCPCNSPILIGLMVTQVSNSLKCLSLILFFHNCKSKECSEVSPDYLSN